MINSFKLFEERLYVSNDFHNTLAHLAYKKNSKVANILLVMCDYDIFTPEIDFIAGSTEEFRDLTFLAKNRAKYDSQELYNQTNYSSKLRQSAKIGRLVRRLIKSASDTLKFRYDDIFYLSKLEKEGENVNIINIPYYLMPTNFNLIFSIASRFELPIEANINGKVVDLYQGQKYDSINIDHKKVTWSSISYSTSLTHLRDIDDATWRYSIQLTLGELVYDTLAKYSGEISIDFNLTVTDAEIESFVNELIGYRKFFDVKSTNLKIVEGEDIRKCYLENNYYGYVGSNKNIEKGQLWNSCMRYPECQSYLDIYVDNCELLVLFNEEEKVMGRALIWKNITGVDINGKEYKNLTFLDRIYTINDSDISLFINYAEENKWAYKNTRNNLLYENIELEYIYTNNIDMEYRYYPYVDTLCYASYSGHMSSSSRSGYDAELNSTDGNFGDDPEPDYDDYDYDEDDD